jgi:hypothetical protein
MEEDLNLELDNVESNTEERLKVKNRFEKLSEKVILTSKERDELAEAKKQLEVDKVSVEKERDFYKDFSVNIAKYPQASAFQDKILEKVKAGYSTEDAMVAVLNKEGKLLPPEPNNPQVEGGSAPTTVEGEKDVNDMNADEKFAKLQELDKTGALASAIRG